MKHLKLFVALFAMLALGVGNAWGYEVEMSTFTATSADMDNYISYTTAQGRAGTAPGIYSNQIRLYQGNPGGNITISAKEGATITEVTIGSAMATKIKWEIDGTVDADNTSLKANGKATKSGISTTSITCHCYGTDKNSRLYVNYLKVVYTVEGGAVKIVKTLKSIAVDGMTTDYETGDIFKFDGTCTATYGVVKNGEPQDDETKVVTPTSVSTPDMLTAGEKEVTVTYTEDEETVTATYIINVTENVITAGEYELSLNNTFFGTSAEATVENFPTSAQQNDITVTLGGGGSKTRTDADCVRMYQNNTLTFSVPAGYVINSIVFTAGGDWRGSISVNIGTYTDATKSWAGSAQEVVFSFGAQNRIATATVTYAEAGETPDGPTTALDNIAVEGKAVKAIVNGQLIIIKNDVQYNAQGQVIK